MSESGTSYIFNHDEPSLLNRQEAPEGECSADS